MYDEIVTPSRKSLVYASLHEGSGFPRKEELYSIIE
jgi:hypothetical protein